ncbi:MAG: hypothetical protein WCG36_07395 [bacterium]
MSRKPVTRSLPPLADVLRRLARGANPAQVAPVNDLGFPHHSHGGRYSL